MRSQVDGDLDLQNGFAALNAVTVLQVRCLNTDSINKCAVGRTQISEKASGRSDFKNTMMPGKKNGRAAGKTVNPRFARS